MPDPQSQNQNQDTTPVHFKDGTTLNLKGKNLSPQQITEGIAKYKAAKGQATPQSTQASPSTSTSTTPSTSTSNPMPGYTGDYSGFTPSNLWEAAKQGGKNALQSITGASPLTPGSEGETHGEGGLIETLANIDKHLPEMGKQSEEIRGQSKAALQRYASKDGHIGDLAEGMTKSVFSMIPMLGPYLNDQYNRGMSGDVGGAFTETGTTLAAAKLVEHVAEKGPNFVKDVKSTFPKHVIVAVSNEALNHVKNGQVGDLAVEGSRDTSKLGKAVQATKDRIGAKFNSLKTADEAKDPNGFVPSKVALTTVDKTIADKGAQILLDKKMMPSVAKIRALVEGYKGNLTFDNIKQMRTFIGDYYAKASGVEKAVLGDLYSSYSGVLKARSAQLGQLAEYLDANSEVENLKKHQDGLIKELKSKNTGLQYFNEITKESNQGRLSDLEKDLHLPTGFFADTARDYGPLHRVASLTEGSSVTGMKGSRISAFMRHPAAVTAGVAAGGGAGAGVGMLMGGHALTGSILGMTAAALKVDDFLNRYDAAKRIREMGGPDNVTGRSSRMVPKGPAGPSEASGSNITGPSTGPGGGGSPAQPPGSTPSGLPSPSGSPVNTAILGPGLTKLLPKAAETAKGAIKFETDSNGIKWAVDPKGIRVSIPKSVAEEDLASYAKGKLEEQGKMQENFKKTGSTSGTSETKPSEPSVTKVPEGQRGREASARKGMTRDTPEARRAKAAERIAAKREEATRTQIKGSIEDQARQVAGRMDFQGKTNLELEEGLKELYGDSGKRFLAEFKRVAKQYKWSDEVYRGYLEDTLEKRAKELASRPAIPGLNSEPKKIE